ncbi:MAG: hypothetical protein ACKVP3_24145 [Hyphomicrobiaceae bacterium]
MAKLEKAMADWPQTQLLKKGVGFHITGRYAHPSLVRSVPQSYGLIGFVLGLMVFVVTENIIAPLFVAGAMWVFYSVWKGMMTNMFGKKVDVKISPDQIQVRQGFGYKKYDRSEPIEFKIERHQKALEEYQREQRRGRKMADTYRQAIEVVMQYGEKRIAIAELPETEMERAKALVIRLQTIANSIDEAVRRMAKGQIGPAAANTGDFGPAPEMR